jgi:pimeloyl-ACP methyl ester carboxylesterase
MGQRVAELLPHAELIRVPGGHHNDLFEQRGVDVIAAIVAFARGASVPTGVEPRR